jgi:hypothetical protein
VKGVGIAGGNRPLLVSVIGEGGESDCLIVGNIVYVARVDHDAEGIELGRREC